jgi:diguanylate cyclase (GGDEF)-like protein
VSAAQEPQAVLVIDDAQDIHDLIDVRLRPEGVTVLHALDADAGLTLARERRPDLILLDLDLPGRSGLELCKDVIGDADLSSIPVLFLTGTVDVATKVRAFDAGAADYITKPFDAVELRARVRSALRTKRLLDLLTTRAQLDGLTGLWNRSHFDGRLTDAIAVADRYQRAVGVLIIDIDHFKALNEAAGHPFGDMVLRTVASALVAPLRAGDIACRYGGEEFGVIMHEIDRVGARAVAERVRQRIGALELTHAGRRVSVTVSVGYASSDMLPPGQPLTTEWLLAAADRGLYISKRAGRDLVSAGDAVETKGFMDTALASLPPHERKPLLPGSRLGPYEVLAAIGAGATGTVYHAFDGRLRRDVALKVLGAEGFRQADVFRRFELEARTLAALDHPHIVRVFDLGATPEGEPFLVLELLEGRTLREHLQGRALPQREALQIVGQLLRALAAAHDKGIVHRDLKPENLFITKDGTVKVLDFGLAKVVGPLVGDHAGTEAGVVLGTVGYLAPEQARAQAVTARSDLFAVGAILYELISGQPAFRRSSPIETLHAIIHDEPSPLNPTGLDEVVRRALAKDPDTRVASARDLERQLAALTEQLGDG